MESLLGATKKARFSGKDHLNLLFSFLASEEPLNDTSAGYFLKGVNNVLTTSGKVRGEGRGG